MGCKFSDTSEINLDAKNSLNNLATQQLSQVHLLRMTEFSGKTYGLSFPTQKSKSDSRVLTKCVFDSCSDEETQTKLLTKEEIGKALEEDPTIFQYDEFYDNAKQTQSTTGFNVAPRKSKYVGRLISTANERKLERELCTERKAHKEIESESKLYGDKESFVTSSYKNKLNELHNLVNKQKEQNDREELMDIKKQDGLGGFYRYMFDSEVGQPCSDLTEKLKENQVESNVTSKDNNSGNDENLGTLLQTQKSSSETHQINSHFKEKQTNNSTQKAAPLPLDSDPYIMARPKITTSEQIEEIRQRFLVRKAAGIHAIIVESD